MADDPVHCDKQKPDAGRIEAELLRLIQARLHGGAEVGEVLELVRTYRAYCMKRMIAGLLRFGRR